MLEEHRSKGDRALIVTDTLFSMDGDLAPLREIVELAEAYEATLVVDEAHATGVYGARGRGVCEELGVLDRVPVRIGTLSKALGGLGGFVVGSQSLIAFLRNYARTYIYSTAMPAANARAAQTALEIVHSRESERAKLRNMARRLRADVANMGYQVGTGDSPIVPIYVGQSDAAVELSRLLRSCGLFVPAIRPPTVPRHRALLRVSLSALHTEAHLEQLLKGLAQSKTTN